MTTAAPSFEDEEETEIEHPAAAELTAAQDADFEEAEPEIEAPAPDVSAGAKGRKPRGEVAVARHYEVESPAAGVTHEEVFADNAPKLLAHSFEVAAQVAPEGDPFSKVVYLKLLDSILAPKKGAEGPAGESSPKETKMLAMKLEAVLQGRGKNQTVTITGVAASREDS